MFSSTDEINKQPIFNNSNFEKVEKNPLLGSMGSTTVGKVKQMTTLPFINLNKALYVGYIVQHTFSVGEDGDGGDWPEACC